MWVVNASPVADPAIPAATPRPVSPAVATALEQVGPRLKRVRTQRRMTLTGVADRTGISKSTLSRLETGQRRPTLELLLALSLLYRVPLDDLVGAPEVGDPRIHLKPGRVKGRTVVPLTRQPDGMQAWKIVIPTSKVNPEPRAHDGYEWIYVLSGRLRLVLGDKDLVLGAGEVAEFDTQIPHWFGSTGEDPAEILSIFCRPGERMTVRTSASRPSPRTRGEEITMTYTLTEVRGPVGIVVLNNPARRNALSKPLVDEIMAALADFARRKLRVAVLRAPPGATVFSAGHDVEELPKSRRDPLGWDDPLRYLVREIENFPAPVIAMLEGGVWGGACEAVFACDLIVAAPDVTFAVTPAKLGVPYNLSGMVTFLNAAPLRIVHEMAFTAKPISAERAERLGMINNVVPKDELESFTMAMASDIAANAPLSIAVMKEQLRILAAARPMSPQGHERVQGLRRIVYDSLDYTEGIRAFEEKRAPEFRGE